MPKNLSKMGLYLAAAYFSVHAAIRLVSGQGLTAPERLMTRAAESVSLFDIGAAPFYLVVLNALRSLFGDEVLAITVLQNGLLFLLCIGVYQLGKMAAGREAGWLSVLSLLAIPQISWMAQVSPSPEVLSTAMAVFVVWRLMRLALKPTLLNGVATGLPMVIGLLSGPEFLFFTLAVTLVALSQRTLWRAVFSKAFLPVIGLSLAAFALAVPGFAGLPVAAAWDAPVFVRAAAAISMIQMAIGYVALMLVIAVIWIYKGLDMREAASPGLTSVRVSLMRLMAVAVTILVLGSFIAGAPIGTSSELQIVLVFAGPVLILFLLPMASQIQTARLTKASGIAVLAILVSAPFYYDETLAPASPGLTVAQMR